MYYDTTVIYGNNKGSEDLFYYGNKCYYKTKSGITKVKSSNCKPIRIPKEEYNSIWNQYKDIFYN